MLASLPLDATPLISYHYLIMIGTAFGEHRSNSEWLNEATTLDADSIVIRQPYMISLETRWGGSLDAMQEFLDASRQAGASTDQLRILDKLIDRERVWLSVRQTEEAAAEERQTCAECVGGGVRR
jgi:hypothetical protein